MAWLKAAADVKMHYGNSGKPWDAPRIKTEQTLTAAILNGASFIIVEDIIVLGDGLNPTAPFQLSPCNFGYGAIPLPFLQHG